MSEEQPPLWATESVPTSLYQEKSVNDIPEQYKNDSGIRFDVRVGTSTQVKFQSIERCTERAILLNILPCGVGEMLEEWFPKKVCTNLNESDCTIRVWTIFLEAQKAHIYEDSSPETEAETKPNG
jgi:hypothetical protein